MTHSGESPLVTAFMHKGIIQNKTGTLKHTFAAGECKRPVFHEPLAEYLAFPTIYCGKTHPDNRVHPAQQRDIFKYGLQSVDTRVASSIPNIFWKAKHEQVRQITNKVSLTVCSNKM